MPTPIPGAVSLDAHPINIIDLALVQQRMMKLIERGKAAISVYQSLRSSLPPKDRPAADADVQDLLVVEGRMVFDYQAMQIGSVRDFRAYDRSFAQFAKQVALLEVSNEKYQTRLDLGRLRMAVEIVRAILGVTQRAQSTIESLSDTVDDLEKKLKKAQKELTETKYQMWINSLLYCGSLLVPELSIMANFVKAFALAGAVMATDHLLGPGSDPWADADATVAAMVDSCPEGYCEAITESVKQYTGAIAAFGTWYFDLREQHEAKETLEKIEEELKPALRDLKFISQWLLQTVPQLPRLRTALRDLSEARGKARAKASAASETYSDFKKEVDKSE